MHRTPKSSGKKHQGSTAAGAGQELVLFDLPPLQCFLCLAVITILCLVPFSGRAFHIDDPLFVWTAKHIVEHPADPYGFEVVWYRTGMRMSEVTKNPPLACYYSAMIGYIAGWSEQILHLAFLVPAVAAVLGSYRLARRLCRTPLLAAVTALLTPAFLVSSSTVMCDTMMLAFWVWAVFLWVEGLDPVRPLYLTAAGGLMAAAALTKYFGISLIPLLLTYAFVRKRRPGNWIWYFLIPIAVLTGYQIWTSVLYGRGLLLDAAQYASTLKSNQNVSTPAKAVVCIGFLGGCMLPALMLAPVLWSRLGVLLGAVLSAFLALVIGMDWAGAGALLPPDNGQLAILQLTFFIGGGISVLALAAADWWKRRDNDAMLLALWVFGTVLFAGFLNWTINARSILPLIPAAAILLMRRLESAPAISGKLMPVRLGIPLLASGLLSIWVAWADAELANAARSAAALIREKASGTTATIWFQGHWGFQYYMEALAGRPVDVSKNELRAGDLMVIPENNNNTFEITPELVASRETIEIPVNMRLSTMHRKMGAGFYFYRWGPLPFAFGPVPPERYQLLRLARLPAPPQESSAK